MISFETLALLINIGIVLAVGIGGLRRRGERGAWALILLSVFVAAWSIGYLLFENPSLVSIRAATRAAIYLAALLAASATFWLVAARTNRGRWLNARTAGLLAVMPVLSLAFSEYGRPPVISQLFLSSAWPRIVALFIFGLGAASALLLWDGLVQRRRTASWRLILALVGSALPLAAVLLEFAALNPFPSAELLPFAFGLATLCYSSTLFDLRPEELGAIDRALTVERMEDGWIVLDAQSRILDMNPAAERLSGYARDQVYGQPINALVGDLSRLGITFDSSQEIEMKRSMGLAEGSRYVSIRFSPLTDRSFNPFGWLTLWRDMTDSRQAEEARLQARDEMFVLINAISSAASNTLSLDDFLLESIYHIIYPFRSQVVSIFLLEDKGTGPEHARYQLASHLGLPSNAIDELMEMPAEFPLFESVKTRAAPVQVKEAADDDRVPAAIRELPVESMLTLPLIARVAGETKFLGCMCLARKEKPEFNQDEIARLSAIAEHMANLIDSDRRRKLAIAVRERERLMRDLHDSVSQKLYGLVATTEAAQAALEAGSNVDPAQEFARIGENARQAVKEMRLFLYQMQQIDVEKDGLVSVLHHRLSAVEGRADIKARLLAEEEGIALSPEKEMALYYIAQEALNNVMRHAKAKSVLVTLKQGRKNVTLEILDDGCGFDLRKVDRAGLGLRNMRERTAQLNGKLRIATKPSEGTRILVTVPRDPGMKPAKHTRQS
jgi:PAS domain S-box-containing protein